MAILKFSAGELPVAAEKILRFAGDQKVFLFYGEMGAGKTTLIKSICRNIGVDDIATSPTFSIVNEYKSPAGPVYHFDFYRIKNESEAFDLGYEDYLYSGNYCFIEWPEKIPNLLPDSAVQIAIEVIGSSERSVVIELI